jgi:hypothetical protein
MRVAATLLLVLLGTTARADDSVPPAVDSIGLAKKDLAEIKSPRGQPDLGALPTMDLRELGPVPGGARPEASPLGPERDPALDALKKKGGSGNWLVDAMDKNTSSQASRTKEKDEILKGDPDLVRADEKGVRLEKDPFALDEAGGKERPKEPLEAVYNPLDAFMSGWISARDHDLLLSPGKGDGAGGADGVRTRADLLPGFEAGASQPAAELKLAQVDPAGFGETKLTANPYLAVVDPAAVAAGSWVAPEATGFAPLELEALPRGLTSPGLDPRPTDPQRSVVPDFAQPGDDDKYFKQLKKF